MPATPTCSSTCVLITIALVVAIGAVVYYMMYPGTDAAAAAEQAGRKYIRIASKLMEGEV